MELSNPWDSELPRLRVLLGLMLGAFLLLGVNLWRIQVLQNPEHNARLERQSVRRVRLPGLRGAITDRHGVVLADNRAAYCLALYVEELRKPGRWAQTVDEVERVLGEIAGVLDVPVQVTRDDIWRHIRKRLPLPLLAWKGLDAAAMARWAERGGGTPGVDVYIEPVRAYPQGSLAAHVLGYVGSAHRTQDWDEDYDYYLPDMVGRSGIEKSCQERLAGRAGGQLIRVDASGFKYRAVGERESATGQSVTLTLDAGLQRLVEAALGGRRGAAVILDPRNGEVLALASAPAFDPAEVRETAGFERLRVDPGRPLFNRAVSGQYPPGSTFKPLVAIAAQENGGISPDRVVDCPGYFQIGGVTFRCWKRSGHGPLAMRKAVEQSCNVYFCDIGLACGYERIYHMADAFGFGRATGIELEYEADGLLPNDAWKRRVRGEGWRSGDTCNVSIGQGALLATPLQMALFAAAIGNGGRVYRPHLVREEAGAGDLVQQLAWSPATLAAVRGGMEDVVEATTGTGRRARIAGVRMAGKTGTAEYGPREDRHKFAWMIAYAPAEDPRYGLALIIEDATSGGTDAAPRVAAVMAGAFGTTPVFPPSEPVLRFEEEEVAL